MKDIKIIATKILSDGSIEMDVKDSRTGDTIRTRTPSDTINHPDKAAIIDDTFKEAAETLMAWR